MNTIPAYILFGAEGQRKECADAAEVGIFMLGRDLRDWKIARIDCQTMTEAGLSADISEMAQQLVAQEIKRLGKIS